MPKIETKSIQLPNGHEAILEQLDSRMTWGEGNIVAPDLSPEQLETVDKAISESLVIVKDEDLKMSGCTDGRGRLQLLDGTEAPVWQKTVGTDLLTLFAMAEVLGEKFYGQTDKGPVMERVQYLINYMTKDQENQDIPTAHLGCGARAGFPTILSNASRLSDQAPGMRSQIIEFGRNKVSDTHIDQVSSKFDERNFEGWDADEVQIKVQEKSGLGAVKELVTDETSNHGHNEAVIVRLNTPGVAFSARKFIELMKTTGDFELEKLNAFSLNDDRVYELARFISDNDEQFETALTAGLLYSEAGWATLGKNQYIVKITDTTG